MELKLIAPGALVKYFAEIRVFLKFKNMLECGALIRAPHSVGFATTILLMKMKNGLDQSRGKIQLWL